MFIARRKYMSEDKISKEIESKFGHHLRIRVNGVLIEGNKILLVKHRMGSSRDFWSTPGGGMQFGSSAQENLVREFLEETNFNKVMVFWDSDTNSSQRKLIYPKYKMNRKSSPNDEEKTDSFNKQKTRVKQYLEEMFIRQLEVENSEADDLIAYYCQISLDEEKTIFSSDKDLTQLISEKVLIYSPNLKSYYKFGDNIKFKNCSIPHYNVMTFKILAGDTSDNIDGISLMGEKTLIKFFPEILDLKTSLTDILTKGELLLKEQKTNVVLGNLLSGKTKEGIMTSSGVEFSCITTKEVIIPSRCIIKSCSITNKVIVISRSCKFTSTNTHKNVFASRNWNRIAWS